MITKAILAGLLIALVEMLHGIARFRLLNPRVGDRRARQLALLSGSLLIFILGFWLVPWIAPRSTSACLLVGLIWLAILMGLDVGVGRFAFRFSWRRILSDFDPTRGGYLGFGMLFLAATPLLVAHLRGLG